MTTMPRVCVIGAGSSGLPATKDLAQRGIAVDCYERSDRIGGNWALGNPNGLSSGYDHLYLNSSKSRTEYADFPMPADYPDYPHISQVEAYLNAYADHFRVREHIQFNTTVEHVDRRADGTWRVLLADGTATTYDAVIVANGHHWKPRWPDPAIPGTFDGEVIHSHDYRSAAELEGRDVVVVGMGNSAMDIVCEAARRARSATLSARRGAHVIPKFVLGRPIDTIPQDPRVPFKLRQAALGLLLRTVQPDPADYGLPRPDHRVGEAHPTISDDLYSLLGHGAIKPKPMVDHFDAGEVVFVDGSRVAADLVVLCTGYQIAFPFLDPTVLSAPDNEIELFYNVFKPGLPDLAVLGLLQPLGSVIPLAEAQAKWVGAYLAGRYALPSESEMRRWIDDNRRRMRQRYVASKRHTIQCDYDDYLYDLAKERRAGVERAAERSYSLPVPPSAASVADWASAVATDDAARVAASRTASD